jgi:FAD:protein FMN transferase
MNTPHAPSSGPVWSRRTVLKVVAAAATLPLGGLAWQVLGSRGAFQTWSGESLGGPASLTLWHPNAAFAQRTLVWTRSEIERLEGVFSLFRDDSEIARLNRDGRLPNASPDLTAVMDVALRVADTSGGAFDPSVQPLWRLYEDYFRADPTATDGPHPAAIEAARGTVGYRGVTVDGRQIGFERAGMALTLNGIAQGYITDRIADLLRNEGFDHAVVSLGETRALGDNPEGMPWSVGLQNPRHPTIVDRTVEIANESVSVSGGYGTVFGASGSHHIFDPATGMSANRLLDVTVIAPRATVADALSTAIFVAGEQAAPRLLAAYPGARAILTRSDGGGVTL